MQCKYHRASVYHPPLVELRKIRLVDSIGPTGVRPKGTEGIVGSRAIIRAMLKAGCTLANMGSD